MNTYTPQDLREAADYCQQHNMPTIAAMLSQAAAQQLLTIDLMNALQDATEVLDKCHNAIETSNYRNPEYCKQLLTRAHASLRPITIKANI